MCENSVEKQQFRSDGRKGQPSRKMHLAADGYVVGITAASRNIAPGPQAGQAQNLNLAIPIDDLKGALSGNARLEEESAPY